MANDLKITPDQLEEPMLDEGKVNVNLTLYDNQLEEMASRSSLYQHISETQNADVSFADLLADDSTTLQAYTDFIPISRQKQHLACKVIPMAGAILLFQRQILKRIS